jgi:DNA repair protein RecO (recombination protein O)
MESRITDQPAFILHRREYRDSSLILELFTEDFGRVAVVARGARKRRDAAHFQICNRLSVGWSGHGELKTLTRIESRAILVPAECYIAVYYINELLLSLLLKQDEHRTLFQQYQVLLLSLDSKNLEPLLRGFEIDLLTQLGLMPDLQIEAISGQPIHVDSEYQLDPEAGFIRASNRRQPVFSGDQILAIAQRDFQNTEVLRNAKRLLRQLIDFNLHGRTLQSRKIYQQLKR